MRKHSVSALLGILTLAGCSAATELLDPAPTNLPVLSAALLCAKQDSLVTAAGQFRTIDKEFEILARLLPGGFGGLFGGGMFLVYPERESDAHAVAITLQSCSGRHAAELSTIQTATAIRGSYDWLQLTVWRERIESDPSVSLVFTDIDESKNRLSIGVPTAAARDQLLGRLEPLKIPAAAVAILVTAPPQPL